jgi:plasmid stabilization system protein ParE
MRIFWTNESRNRLKDIYDYFSLNVSEKTAKKLINDIIGYSEILASSPGIGQKENLLNSRTNNYQYLLFGNYKIIYWIKMNVVYIATVFDTRQNPKKLRNLKDSPSN